MLKIVFVYMGREKVKHRQQVMIYTLIKAINLWHFCACAPKFSVALHISKWQICQGQLLTHTHRQFWCSWFLVLPGSLCISDCWWRTRTFAVWYNQGTEIRWLGSASICLHMRSSPVAYRSTRHFCFTDICCFCSTPNCNIPSGLKCLERLQKYRDVLVNILGYKKMVVKGWLIFNSKIAGFL